NLTAKGVYRRGQSERMDANRACDCACASHQRKQDRELRSLRHLERSRRDLARAAAPAPRQPLHQPIELVEIVAVETRARRAHRGAADGAAPAQDLLADRKADADLLLVPHQRQIGVEQVLGLLGAAVAEEAAYV